MIEPKAKRVFWYTRRGSVVRGPYPAGQISRYILLGRIREADELRCDGGEWQALDNYPELIPEVMKLPPTEENRQKLLMARMREDERRPLDRRDTRAASAEALERRGGHERRRKETEEERRYRELKYQLSHRSRSTAHLYRYPVIFTVIVMLGFVLSYALERIEPEVAPPDCAAGPRPGVNWNNCNLSGLRSERAELIGAQMRNVRLDSAQLSGAQLVGADMEYTSLNLSNLQRADLSHARLVGVTMRGTDLRGARLLDADLSYANLSGARIEGADFSGAVLDHAIWIDQKPCGPNSRGVCRQALQGQ